MNSKHKQTHTFRSGSGILIGADHSLKSLLQSINDAGEEGIEIGGEQCKAMGHGLVIWTGSDPLFVEVDKEKLLVLENKLIDK